MKFQSWPEKQFYEIIYQRGGEEHYSHLSEVRQ